MSPTVHPRAAFAASNSSHGFRNYYGDIFTDRRVDRLYVIKGGPGTGKSHFMKVVARRARTIGYDVEEFYCSSDPQSLDGVRLTKDGAPALGIVDGTAPHVREPHLPGAVDEIINLGVFWDASRLSAERDVIRTLTEDKANAYKRAYGYLSAAGGVGAVGASLMQGCFDEARISSLARRLIKGQPEGEVHEATPAIRSALGMTGYMTLHSYEQACREAKGSLVVIEDYLIRGSGSVGAALMGRLWELSKERRLRVYVSYDPIYPEVIDGLYYPDTGLCILLGHAEPTEGTPTRMIPMRRYVDATALRPLRGKLRHAATLMRELTDAAGQSLREAAAYHFDLESIYAAAMDFSAKEAFTESFCQSLFLG